MTKENRRSAKFSLRLTAQSSLGHGHMDLHLFSWLKTLIAATKQNIWEPVDHSFISTENLPQQCQLLFYITSSSGSQSFNKSNHFAFAFVFTQNINVR